MPLYEYRCESCEHQFEVIQKFSDPHVSVCPKCGNGPVVKLISSPAFTFKGTGFYITDYARKDHGKGDQDKSDGSSSSSSDKSEKPDKPDKRKPDKSSDKGSDKGTDSKAAASDTASTSSTTTTPKGD